MYQTTQSSSVIYAQPDFFFSGSRLAGVVPGDLTLVVFANDTPLDWTLVDGTDVPDSTIRAGSVYFNEIAGNPGFYAVRLWVDRIGFWRIVLTHADAGEASIEASAMIQVQVPQILFGSPI